MHLEEEKESKTASTIVFCVSMFCLFILVKLFLLSLLTVISGYEIFSKQVRNYCFKGKISLGCTNVNI